MLTIVHAIPVSASDTITEPWLDTVNGDLAVFVWYDMITTGSPVIDEEESLHQATPYTRLASANSDTVHLDYRLLNGTEPQDGGSRYVQLPTFVVGMHITLRHPDGAISAPVLELGATTSSGLETAHIENFSPSSQSNEFIIPILVEGTGGAGALGLTPDDGWMGNSGIFGGAQDGAGVRTMADVLLPYNDTVTDYGYAIDRGGSGAIITNYEFAFNVEAGPSEDIEEWKVVRKAR